MAAYGSHIFFSGYTIVHLLKVTNGVTNKVLWLNRNMLTDRLKNVGIADSTYATDLPPASVHVRRDKLFLNRSHFLSQTKLEVLGSVSPFPLD